MPRPNTLSTFGVTLLILYALGLTITNLWSWGRRPTSIPQRVVREWRSYAEGHSTGQVGAPVTVVVFSAYNCRYCSRFWLRLNRVVNLDPEFVTVYYRHMPLDSLGRSAAAAAVCAAKQGGFSAISHVMFAHSDSLRTLTWRQYAHAAGIRDEHAFLECLGRPETSQVIQADIAAAQRLGAIGTPTYLVNNELYVGDSWDLRQIILNHHKPMAPLRGPFRGLASAIAALRLEGHSP